MKNHLIIGLGGTGGKIIRSFRKMIYQNFRKENPDKVHIAYLYMDSSSEMMDLNDPEWKVLGHSVQLGKNSQMKIGGANLHTILDNIQNYPGIKGWIGDKNQWKEILNSIVGETLGGQKRRLGRFLFANRVTDFNDRLSHLINELRNQSSIEATTFHICCGLAGGTGSGSLIDVIAQIRNMGFDDQDTYRIILYVLLPDDNPPKNWDTGNYHANGFAALTELNALSVGELKPHDLTGQRNRLELQDPFNGCYVFTNKNENGITVDVDKGMPDITADFLYQKVVAVRNLEQWPGTLMKQENSENGDGLPETAPHTKNPERSKRFMAFGIKRLAVPEEEILEYMTYSFASQAALQLLYNNWQDGAGFEDEPKNADFREYVQQEASLERWRLKDDHICLSLGILESDTGNKKWKPIAIEWQDFVANSRQLIRENRKEEVWPDELETICQKRFSEDYRTSGVVKFYENKLRARQEMAKEICSLIEADLFDEWRTGVKSMYEIRQLMEDLIMVTEERHKNIEDRKSKLENRESNIIKEIENRKKEWANMSMIARVAGKGKKIFEAQSVNFQHFYEIQTWIKGWEFARRLLEELKEQLNDLKQETDECFSRIKKANDIFKANIDARCKDESGDLKKHLIRYYNPRQVKDITARFSRDFSIQGTHTSGVRSLLVKKTGERPGFASFNRNISVMQLIDSLENECEKSVKRAHETVLQSVRERLMDVNIIERLENQYDVNYHDLKNFIFSLSGFAGNYVIFDQQEKAKQGHGIPASPNCVNEFTAILPKSQSDFMDRLKQALTESRGGKVNIVETDAASNEITLISITNLFPLRFIKTVKDLQKKYDLRLNALGKDRATLELHIEGDGSQFPPVFVKSGKEILEEGIRYFLLAKAAGVICQRENQTTGATVLSVLTKDEYGIPNEPADLGGSADEIMTSLENPGLVNLIKDEAGKILNQKEYQHKDKKTEIINAMIAETEVVKAERGMDDEVYKLFLKCTREAVQVLG